MPLAWWLAVRARPAPRSAAVVALAVCTLLFFLLVGVGRVGLGVDESKTSRYVYITAVLLLPADRGGGVTARAGATCSSPR